MVEQLPITNQQMTEASQNNGIKEKDGKLNYEIDWEFIEEMAKVMANNKHKYPPDNWKKPIEVKDLIQPLTRHFIEIGKGNYDDGDEILGHLKSIALNAMMIHYQLKHYAK